MCLARAAARGLDDVRIDRALREELHAGELLRFLVEDLDKQASDDLALRFRVRDARERREEASFGVDTNDPHAKMLGERAHDLVAFVESQQAMIDEDAHELVADRAMEQGGDHRRVDAAGEP